MPRFNLRVDTSAPAPSAAAASSQGGGAGDASAPAASAAAAAPCPTHTLLTALQAQSQAQAFSSPLAAPAMCHFAVLALLGRGATSVVHRVRHLPSGQEYALKCIPVPGDEARRAETLREVSALQASCSGMVACHGCFLHEDSVHLVLQLMEGGTLEGLVRARGALPERVAAALAYQLFWCLARMRHAHLLHRDVKPSNVLLAPSGAVRLGDAGLAKDTVSIEQVHSFVGTFKYMAPERLLQAPYAFPADVYGAALCALHAVLGAEPLAEAGAAFMDVLVAAMEAPALLIPPDGTALRGGSGGSSGSSAGGSSSSGGGEAAPTLRLSPAFRELLSSCLQRDPAARPTADAALLLPVFAANGIADRPASEAIVRAFVGPCSAERSSAVKRLELI